ncbi:MAG: protease HtpX [Nanoarchaeota archaeon]|jgi:heat shock protein HtpX|nr:protease HtpX [Nanoarchaeota archaeon]|tara:strand:- start:67287 stop:68138 length:852 start_codon:yes stop_codon:yes gene_type:complete
MLNNQLKTVLFLGILTGILLAIGQLLGGYSGLALAFVFAIVMNVGSYFYSHKLVLKMYKAKEASLEEYADLHKMVQEVSQLANVPKPKIYIVPSENPNAFCTGPNPQKAVLGYTQGILDLLSEEELKGVTAHEIAHDKNRDMLISTIAATIASVISYVAFMARWGAIFGGIGGDRDGDNNVIGLLILAIVAPLAATLIHLAISRSREFIADETGARFIHNAAPLANALEKLEDYGKQAPMRMGTDSTNSLFIVNPFRGKKLLSLFMTHPPTEKRVERLKSLMI